MSIDKNFLSSKRWKDFRKTLREERKICEMTESRLTKSYNLHHLNTDTDCYTDISCKDNFSCLNPKSHVIVEFFWRTKDWRKTLKNLENILLKMEQLTKKGE